MSVLCFIVKRNFAAALERHLEAAPPTCYVKFYLQGHFVGQRGVAQQLVGLFQCSVFCGDSVDGQEAVSHLQQATPTRTVTTVMSDGCKIRLSKPHKNFGIINADDSSALMLSDG